MAKRAVRLPWGLSKIEIRDIVIATVALGAIFAWRALFAGDWLTVAILMGVVAASFLPHEFGHRALARRFGQAARFEMWKTGLLLALIFAAATGGRIIFAAPGAVVIYPRYDVWGQAKRLEKKEYALISMIGPVVNLIIASVSFALLQLGFLPQITGVIGALFSINAFLAFFNLLPIPPLDGSKVIWWNVPVWLALIAISGVFSFAF